MRLRLREGAVVEFLMMGGYREDDTFVGKVIEVNEDEVIIIQQTGIIHWSSDPCAEYDPLPTREKYESIDFGGLIHINRHAILGWRYVKTERFKNDKNFMDGKERDSWREKTTIKDYTINHYDKSGYCKGDGKDFSNY